jgi:hypothetical protein
MTLSFLHQENIRILWKAIHKYPLIQNLHTEQQQITWFNNAINQMQSRIPQEYLYSSGKNGQGVPTPVLNNLNKETILFMVNDLKARFSNQEFKEPYRASQGTTKKSDATQQMQQSFLEKQREFEHLMQPNKPASLEFPSEDKDEPIKNMDELIKLHIRARELDVAPLPPIDPSMNNAPAGNHIQILEEPITISVSEIPRDTPTKKHVTFHDTNEGLMQQLDLEYRIQQLEQELYDMRQMVLEIHGMLLSRHDDHIRRDVGGSKALDAPQPQEL